MKLKNFSIIFRFHLAEIKKYIFVSNFYGPRIQRDADTKRRQKNRKPNKIESSERFKKKECFVVVVSI